MKPYLGSPLQTNLKIPRKTLALFSAKKKALSNANPKTLEFASEIRVFYEFFFFIGSTQSARAQPQPKPGHDN